MDNLISRQAAIDAVENIDCSDGVGISALKCEAVDDGVTAIKALPTAQPETHEERTETHACDLISRKMVLALPRNKVRSLRTYEVVEETINVTDIEHLPSAQPDLEEAYICGETEAEARFHAEIVRCKGCKHWSRESICDGFCSEDCMRHDEDFYCGYAERKTDGN